MKQRYFIFLSYKGTAYHGWQIQPNGISVQALLMDAFSTVLRTNIEIVGAGRTDTGVHAQLMVAHFDFEGSLAAFPNLISRLNNILARDISISKILAVQSDAHARFDAVSRKYEYHIIFKKDVFKYGLAARFNGNFDFKRMNEAAATILEYRDFTSFSKLHTDAKTNNCVVKQAQWIQKAENEWVFVIEADRFLRNMVRAIVGTLLEVGRGKINVEQFRQIIEAQDRCKAGVSVPAEGLYLVDIKYPESIFIID